MSDHFANTRRCRVKNCHGKCIKIVWLCFFSKNPLLVIMDILGLVNLGGPWYTYTAWTHYRPAWKISLFRKLKDKHVLFLYPQYIAVTLNITIIYQFEFTPFLNISIFFLELSAFIIYHLVFGCLIFYFPNFVQLENNNKNISIKRNVFHLPLLKDVICHSKILMNWYANLGIWKSLCFNHNFK